MTLHGSGTLCYPGTARVVHDFEDGPFDTYDPTLINHALAVGCANEPVTVKPVQKAEQPEVVAAVNHTRKRKTP
jgi:hypothetical protein